MVGLFSLFKTFERRLSSKREVNVVPPLASRFAVYKLNRSPLNRDLDELEGAIDPSLPSHVVDGRFDRSYPRSTTAPAASSVFALNSRSPRKVNTRHALTSEAIYVRDSYDLGLARCHETKSQVESLASTSLVGGMKQNMLSRLNSA